MVGGFPSLSCLYGPITHAYTKFQQNPFICGRVILVEPQSLLEGEWSELHQIWPGHLNTIGQYAVDYGRFD